MPLVPDLSGNGITDLHVSEADDMILLSAIPNLGYWSVPLTGFTNPKYVGSNSDSPIGFDISDATAILVSYENSATASIVYEQSLDITGQAGWFAVIAKTVNSASGALVTNGSSSGVAYLVPAYGIRMRIRVTALTVADLRVRIAQANHVIDISSGVISSTTGGIPVTSNIAENITATSTSAIGIALEGRNTQKSPVAATGSVVRAQGTMDGKQVTILNSIPDTTWQYAAITGGIVSSIADVVLQIANVTYRNYITGIAISHDTLAGPTEWVLKDGATVVCRGRIQAVANEGIDLDFPTPVRCSVNSALSFALITSVTGSVYVNAQGFVGV